MTEGLILLDDKTLSEYRRLFSRAPEFRRIHDSKDSRMLDELYDFYEEAARLLAHVIAKLFGKNLLEDRGSLRVDYEITGHGMTYTNLKGELTGNLGSMLICPGDEELELIIRQLNAGTPDKEIGRMVKQAIDRGSPFAVSQHQSIDPHRVRFASDIPRALHHAILKYDPSKESELEGIALKQQVKQGAINQKDYLHL